MSGLDGESTPDTEQNTVSGYIRKRTCFFFFLKNMGHLVWPGHGYLGRDG